jgi:hypothetical protein
MLETATVRQHQTAVQPFPHKKTGALSAGSCFLLAEVVFDLGGTIIRIRR